MPSDGEPVWSPVVWGSWHDDFWGRYRFGVSYWYETSPSGAQVIVNQRTYVERQNNEEGKVAGQFGVGGLP